MFNKIVNRASDAESFLSNGWIRFIGIPIIIAFLGVVYLVLS